MLGRTAIVVIPTLAVAVTAGVLLGPGALRPAVGVQVYGFAAEGGRSVALRIEAVKSLYDINESTPLDAIRVDATIGGNRIGTWTGDAGADGIAEAFLASPAPLTSPLGLVVTRKGTLLALGTLQLFPQAAAAPIPGFLSGNKLGDLVVRVEAVRGALAAPFPEEMRVFVTEPTTEHLGVRADLEVTALGGDVTPQKLATDDHGAARFVMKPLAHDVSLTVEAKAGSRSGHWDGTLPIVPGACWIDPAGAPSGPLTVVSPAPRERAYVSFWTGQSRAGGEVAQLHRDADGFFRGSIAVPPVTATGLLYATVAGDPLERGAGTVAWPLRPAEGAVAIRPIDLLLDGLPSARDRERARVWSARKAAILVVAAAAMAEILLLLYRGREQQRELEDHFVGEDAPPLSAAEKAGLLGAARDRPILRALTAIALIGLGFAIIAALATFRAR